MLCAPSPSPRPGIARESTSSSDEKILSIKKISKEKRFIVDERKFEYLIFNRERKFSVLKEARFTLLKTRFINIQAPVNDETWRKSVD